MTRRIDRRSLLAGVSTLALGACRKPSSPAPEESAGAPDPPPPGGVWRTASFDATPDLPQGERAMLLDPWPREGAPPPERRPLLVALHGAGEASRGLDVGAGAWPSEYALADLHRRLYAPPLVEADLHHMTSPERLRRLNASLAARPYRGIALACPWTPRLGDPTPEGARPFARFVLDQLLPRLRADSGSKADRAATGIDGVSMGGRLALLVGLLHPEVFGAVGALQPALREEDGEMVSALARVAMARAKVNLRLVTSDDDYFLGAVKAVSARLRADGVEHELAILPGTHGYEFNRGPGGAEMLLWHERVQRGLPSPDAPPPGPEAAEEAP